jgi:hypothetical protein
VAAKRQSRYEDVGIPKESVGEQPAQVYAPVGREMFYLLVSATTGFSSSFE